MFEKSLSRDANHYYKLCFYILLSSFFQKSNPIAFNIGFTPKKIRGLGNIIGRKRQATASASGPATPKVRKLVRLFDNTVSPSPKTVRTRPASVADAQHPSSLGGTLFQSPSVRLRPASVAGTTFLSSPGWAEDANPVRKPPLKRTSILAQDSSSRFKASSRSGSTRQTYRKFGSPTPDSYGSNSALPLPKFTFGQYDDNDDENDIF